MTPTQSIIHAHVNRIGMQSEDARAAGALDAANHLAACSEALHQMVGPHTHEGDGGSETPAPVPTVTRSI